MCFLDLHAARNTKYIKNEVLYSPYGLKTDFWKENENINTSATSKTYLGPCQVSELEYFVKTVKDF